MVRYTYTRLGSGGDPNDAVRAIIGLEGRALDVVE